MAISTVEDLREHLQWAIQLEHSTIPPYLTALYSIKPGTNVEASHVITSVFIEEMLHMTLAANVLNAIGGAPSLDRPDFTPSYPSFLPHSACAFEVSLEKFSPEALSTFMNIERPAHSDDPAEDDEYDTIGQFYLAIELGLKHLAEELGEKALFTGDPDRQITSEDFDYHASGRIIPVYDLASALEALDEIVEQGEGHDHKEVWDGDRDMFHPEREEVAHYYRYMEVQQERKFKRGDTPQSGPTGDLLPVEWDEVYPIKRNLKTSDLRGGSRVVSKIGEFNLAYSDLLRDLQRAFNGERQRLARTLPGMHHLSTIARAIVKMRIGDTDYHACPTFEYVPASFFEGTADSSYKVQVIENGPYHISGGVPLTKKSIVYSELNEPLTWRKDETLETESTVRLCRCGQSKNKPYCDNSHAAAGFKGTEHPPSGPSAARTRRFEGTNIAMTDDSVLCVHAGFCGNHVENVWEMITKTDDTRERFALMQMVERCPSGKLSYEIDGVTVEPDLPTGIAVTKNGPYWVTGGITVETSTGEKLEVRNRVTLCRCGKSKIKPFCDGTHVAAGFDDEE